jgi:hypothetical protein
MMTTLTIKINEQSKAGKTFLEMLDFFNSKEKKNIEVVQDESPYNPEFVAKIRESEKQIREGKFTVINPKDVWNSLGL